MPRFRSDRSILAGRSTEQLQTDLTAAQDAYIALQSGKRAVSLSYSQGDGSKAVTYTQANVADLVQLIKLLQAQLGIVCDPRRPIKVVF